MFNRAIDWNLLDQSPMKGIRFLPENNARLRYLSLEECQRIIEACKAPHLRAIVTIALHTGMRSGEIRSLHWRDLDFDTGFLIVRDTKNGETRHVPMDSTVVALLRTWPRTEGSEFVFTNAQGGRIGWLQHAFRKALTRSSLSDLHFHDLRHTFASQWMMNGGDLFVLKSILGSWAMRTFEDPGSLSHLIVEQRCGQSGPRRIRDLPTPARTPFEHAAMVPTLHSSAISRADPDKSLCSCAV